MSPTDSAVASRLEGSTLRLTLDRPEKRNALSASLVADLKRALRVAAADDAVRVVALAGAGKDFCAGADLSEIHETASASVGENLRNAEALGELFVQLRRLPKPVVAVVHGRALAGGCGLALACDLVLAAESARFGLPEVTIGFVPAMVLALLRRSLGEKKAFELACLGRSISAREAESLGLVNRCFDDGELEAGARDLLETLSKRSATALALSKGLLYQQETLGFEAAVQAGADVNVLARQTEDARRGIAAFTRGGGRGG